MNRFFGLLVDCGFNQVRVTATATGPVTSWRCRSAASPFSWTVYDAGSEIRTSDGMSCVDNSSSPTTDGNPVGLASCNTTGAQRWALIGTTLTVQGMCLAPSATGPGVAVWSCDGSAGQQWNVTPDGLSGTWPRVAA